MRPRLFGAFLAFSLVAVVLLVSCSGERDDASEAGSPARAVPESGDENFYDEGASEFDRQIEIDNAHEEGYQDGYEEGRDAAYQPAYDEGYDEGYYTGFDEGCVALGDRLIELAVIDWYRCPSP